MCPLPVTYYIGWNLAAGTEGNLGGGAPEQTYMTGALDPLYTLRAGDTEYEIVPTSAPVKAGWGYWAYFAKNTTETLAQVRGREPFALQLPAGQFVMVGNLFPDDVRVSGADVVYTYTPFYGGGRYQEASTLQYGQGAWAYSEDGGTLVFTPTDP